MQRRIPKTIDGDECWMCPTCGHWKPSRDYYARSKSWNGIGVQCRKCHIEGNVRTRDKGLSRDSTRKSMARMRLLNPEKQRKRERIAARNRKWSHKSEARYQLNLAVRRGDVVKPDGCIRCGQINKLHAHHSDYSKPLEVEWLCTLCHGKEHRHV